MKALNDFQYLIEATDDQYLTKGYSIIILYRYTFYSPNL